jgi:hypothetical protein
VRIAQFLFLLNGIIERPGPIDPREESSRSIASTIHPRLLIIAQALTKRPPWRDRLLDAGTVSLDCDTVITFAAYTTQRASFPTLFR